MATTGQKYRAQILLEPEQHKKLAEIAANEGRSVSDVVREAVAKYVLTKSHEDQWERKSFDNTANKCFVNGAENPLMLIL
jgi:predicted DNA-binding protein